MISMKAHCSKIRKKVKFGVVAEASEVLNQRFWKKKIKRTDMLILAFEIIVQPPKHTFEIALFFNFRALYNAVITISQHNWAMHTHIWQRVHISAE